MLKRAYSILKRRYLNSLGYQVPEKYQSTFVCWGGAAEVQYIYGRFLKELPFGSRILIVGVMGGRDYFYFKNLGYKVTALDLGLQPEIENIVIANVEEPLPFPPDYFDAIILGEVLEHLKYDVRALDNLRTVLMPSGLLIVSLPFFHDSEEGHMRIHSPKSGRRLLSMAGFKVVDYLERPGLMWWNSIQNIVLHSICLLSWALLRKTAYKCEIALIGRFEWITGHLQWPRIIRRLSTKYGGYYLCQKDIQFDHLSLNRTLYTSAEKAEPSVIASSVMCDDPGANIRAEVVDGSTAFFN
jgi:SAM-dependent methyltransferase